MKKSNNVKSVMKALRLFNELIKNGKPVSLSSLSNKTEMNISTVYRLLNTMAAMGYVEQDINDHYYLGHFAYRIAEQIQDSLDWKEFIHPYLEEIVELCNETASFTRLQNRQILYLDEVKSTHMLKIITDTGDTKPAYCTAAGKILLSHLDKKRLRKYIDNTQFIKYSENTVTDAQRLVELLEKIKEQGYAVEIEEFEEGVVSVAAAIISKKKKIQGALTISGPCTRIDNFQLKNNLIPLIKNKAIEISCELSEKEMIS
ncbi:MAG: IclR family transcriptional regulator [Halanaerobiales bacterium]